MRDGHRRFQMSATIFLHSSSTMPRNELVVLVVAAVCCFFLPIGAYLTPSSLRIGRKIDRTRTRQHRFRSQPLFVASPTTRTKKGGGTKLADKEREIVRLGRSGSTDRALELFQSIGRPTIRIVNAALDACARARPARFDQALELLDDSLQQYPHLKPNVFTFGALMSACSRARQPDRALQLLRTMQVSRRRCRCRRPRAPKCIDTQITYFVAYLIPG